MSAYPVDLYPGCPCYRCDSPTWSSISGIPLARMTLCPTCGNKRCPGASDHDNVCSGSNEPGQPGSRYAGVKPTPEATANLLLELAVDWARELISQHRGATARRRLADGLEAAMRALGEPTATYAAEDLTDDSLREWLR